MSDQINITPKGFKTARSEMSAEELDKPIDVYVAPVVTPEPAVEPVATPEIKEEETVKAETEPEEPRIPRSRFLTMHQRAIEAEKRLREFEAERSEAAFEPQKNTEVTELPDYWIEMFGDSDASKKAFDAEQQRLSTIEEKAAERAYQRLEGREKEAEKRTQEIIASFDEAFEELSITADKEFSDEEQVAILDIVEKYSPKDKDGKLLREFLMPLDQAYEIYAVQHEAKSAVQRTARNAVATLTSTPSEGSASATSAKGWQPGQWRNKVP